VKGFSDIVSTLISDPQCDLTKVYNNSGETAADIARSRGHHNIYKMIQTEIQLRQTKSSSFNRLEFANNAPLEQRFRKGFMVQVKEGFVNAESEAIAIYSHCLIIEIKFKLN